MILKDLLTWYCLPGMLWLSQLTSSPYLCVAIMSVAYTCNGAHYSGDSVNLLGIAPNRYTGSHKPQGSIDALIDV